ncbi:homocysteine S-methyltransferase family protein, partial [Cobetia sp. SIMBA_158]|uniref:homocysteine S-methyltransferase family protein n=1 Tax=Cobetia sp. SIMBA_158 TaxID=3081617 RepID=UPI003981172C
YRDISPSEYLGFAKKWHALGATIIGGCCGIGPEFIEVLVNWKQELPENVLSAYKDNAAVMKGSKAGRFFPNAQGEYAYHQEDIEILMKVETHNHPT